MCLPMVLLANNERRENHHLNEPTVTTSLQYTEITALQQEVQNLISLTGSHNNPQGLGPSRTCSLLPRAPKPHMIMRAPIWRQEADMAEASCGLGFDVIVRCLLQAGETVWQQEQGACSRERHRAATTTMVHRNRVTQSEECCFSHCVQ